MKLVFSCLELAQTGLSLFERLLIILILSLISGCLRLEFLILFLRRFGTVEDVIELTYRYFLVYEWFTMSVVHMEACPDTLSGSGFIYGDEEIREVFDHLLLNPSTVRLHSASHRILIELDTQERLNLFIERAFVELDLVLDVYLQ